MHSLYPDILFHFTSKTGLWGILQDTFHISYAREKIVGHKKSTEFAVPMVSFCDLKVSELKNHMEKYGNYGIGLTKEWANKNDLNPVLYVNKNCSFTKNFIDAVETLYRQLDNVHDLEELQISEKTYMDILNTYRYIKNYEGDLVRKNGKKTKNYRFADEREWRYIPPVGINNFPFVSANMLAKPKAKQELNKLFSDVKLRFQPEDIKYLIIKSDNEIIELIDHLEAVKGRFNAKTRQRLASRILTSEQINRDI